MSMMEAFKMMTDKNHYAVRSCLVISLVSVTAWITVSVLLKKKKKRENYNNQQYENDESMTPLIVITGCDTGLGYSVVMRYLKDNNKIVPRTFAVLAFCLNPNGPGPQSLLQEALKNKNVHYFVQKLDLTDNQSIQNGVNFVSNLLEKNVNVNKTIDKGLYGDFNYKLHALVNNAGRMVMAEFEWQTTQLVQQQFEVNVLGPMKFTAQLLPFIREYKSRVINITSHCAYLPLPGISVYGATKAAVRAWTLGARIELENHGVKMITFSPGSFCLYSSIMSGQQRIMDYKQMLEHMTGEQSAYYGTYFNAYQNYLSYIEAYISSPETTIPSTNKIYSEMDHALWAVQPKAEYTVPEPWRYRYYFVLARTLSVFGLHHLKDEVVCRFVATPRFKDIVTSQEEKIPNEPVH